MSIYQTSTYMNPAFAQPLRLFAWQGAYRGTGLPHVDGAESLGRLKYLLQVKPYGASLNRYLQ